MFELHEEVLRQVKFRRVVFVVDDEPPFADTVGALLLRETYVVLTAYDAERALNLATKARPNLLIHDGSMPGMNGIDLVIAMQKAIPDCKVPLF